jgi:hypothetical protein
MWMITAQIDNLNGNSEVDVPQDGLKLIAIPTAWVMLIAPTSVALKVPAHSATQLSIGGLYLYRGQNPPSSLGLPQIILAGRQAARLQLTAYAWGMPLLRGVNPPNTSPFVKGMIE